MEIWATVILSLTLVYAIFLWPHFRSNAFSGQEACAMVRTGMTLSEVLKAVHLRSDPVYEGFHNNVLTLGGYNRCDITLQDGKAISSDVVPDL